MGLMNHFHFLLAETTRSLHYTDWSEWSVCNRHCSQNRVKRCRVESKCGNSVLRVSSFVSLSYTLDCSIFEMHNRWTLFFIRRNEVVTTREKVGDEDANRERNEGTNAKMNDCMFCRSVYYIFNHKNIFKLGFHFPVTIETEI